MNTYYDQDGNKLDDKRALALLLQGHYIIDVTADDVHRISVQRHRHFTGLTPVQALDRIKAAQRKGILE